MSADSAIPKYEMRIYWSDDDQAYVVEVPDLPGCAAHGDTPTEAAEMAQQAIRAWIDCAREDGERIPEPRPHRAFA